MQLCTLLCLCHGAQLWGINLSFSALGSFCVGPPISKAARAWGAFCQVCWSLQVQKFGCLVTVVVASCVLVRPLFWCGWPFDVVAGFGFECRNMAIVTPGSMEPWCSGEWASPLSCRATGTSLPAPHYGLVFDTMLLYAMVEIVEACVDLRYVLWLALALGLPGPMVLACVTAGKCRFGNCC
jgi:hypothetical protein